ncbi:hypothetical protein [Streptomyces sp. V1I1]|uniref:hypothetical protein n=1 Tax=Streptomyces sp. V1I1 TaxID=3042272 RepID=UPI0027827536|nr:hypothetical protein [Streptomyces sp. V1I1]MDQ0938401.1 hypothetical protein [Streptomyces sp. V1I1]
MSSEGRAVTLLALLGLSGPVAVCAPHVAHALAVPAPVSRPDMPPTDDLDFPQPDGKVPGGSL